MLSIIIQSNLNCNIKQDLKARLLFLGQNCESNDLDYSRINNSFLSSSVVCIVCLLKLMNKKHKVGISGDTTMGVLGEIDRLPLSTSAIDIINGIRHNIHLPLHLHQQ